MTSSNGESVVKNAGFVELVTLSSCFVGLVPISLGFVALVAVFSDASTSVIDQCCYTYYVNRSTYLRDSLGLKDD